MSKDFDILETLRTELNAKGLNVPYLNTEYRWHRCSTADKPSNFNGAYRCVLDGKVPYVVYWNWAQDCDTEDGKGVIPLISEGKMTPEQRRYFNERAIQDRQEFEEWQTRQHRATKSKAQKIYENLKNATNAHAYFVVKQVPCPFGVKVTKENRLAIPIMGKNAKGEDEVMSLLFIDEQGNKRFLKGGQKKNGYFPIALHENPNKPLCIAEGVSTALSIHMATKHPCIVAFDANNLGNVARIARQNYPNRTIILCADNDHGGDHE